jgi:predicted nucleic acid-binding protein
MAIEVKIKMKDMTPNISVLADLPACMLARFLEENGRCPYLIQTSMVDYVIAATAWAKNLPLMTRNRKHFKHIKEITLSPVYEYE